MSRAALRRLGRTGLLLVALVACGPVLAQTFPLVGARPGAARAASPHGEIAVACEACHTARAWTPVRDDPDFDHARQTGFALDGRHAATECASCHLDLRFDEPEGANCASCHLDVHAGTLGTTCQTCHGTVDFGEVRGEAVHARTSFPLTGAHGLVACTTCHAAGAGGALGAAFGAIPSDCQSCHADEAAATAGGPVDHVAAGFPADCETCHTTVSFGGAGFEHAAASDGFALVGAHIALPCSACHTAGLGTAFQPDGQDDCQTCHADDAAAVTSPNHAGFPTTCTECHGTTAWTGATFDHTAASGRFTLAGAHTAVACQSCHTGPDNTLPWTPTGPDDCQSCHAADAAAVVTPSHAGFPATCTQCHTTATWAGAAFDHPAVSGGFALAGAHAALSCATCHSGPDGGVPWTPAGQNDCQSCHVSDAAAVVTPSHANFSPTCTQCHTTATWSGASFDHVAASGGFSLVGAHGALACASCHSNADGSLPWTPAGQDDCQSCHASDAPSAPVNHTTFPPTCQTCHGTATWSGATANHAVLSGGFALVGAHISLACNACHTGPSNEVPWNPSGQDDCQTCHADDAAAATPSHTGFPATCTTCHTATAWGGATVNHPALSGGFGLVGAHAVLACQTCHSGPGNEVPWTPANQNDCQSCHAADAPAATPNHTGFPATCTSCHGTGTWAGATVDHVAVSGGYPLVGAHAALSCATCHSGPGNSLPWSPTGPTDCFACHADDYQSVHAGSGFPTTCSECHGTTTWDGATFDHPAFPITSGDHAGVACQTCHTQPTQPQVFTCLTCHEHRRSEMDDEHEDVRGYSYSSPACYNCHPDGRDRLALPDR